MWVSSWLGKLSVAVTLTVLASALADAPAWADGDSRRRSDDVTARPADDRPAYQGADPFFVPPTVAKTDPDIAWNPSPGRLRSQPGFLSMLALVGMHGAAYGLATRVGSRRGLTSEFKIVRLESAYAYDLVGHVFMVREVGGAMAAFAQWTGSDPATSRTQGVWWGAFGSYTYMEAINGFMPNVRFDPLDPFANLLGAWLATGGRTLAQRHPWMRRFTLEFGYKSWRRAFGPKRDDAALGNIWHDHPNGRFGLGFHFGPLDRPWVTLFGSYEITSLRIEQLQNRFGLGLELHPLHWLAPALSQVPGGGALLTVTDWLDRRFLLPGLYVQLWHVDVGPFSDRQPFRE